jgi:hypothetical protein
MKTDLEKIKNNIRINQGIGRIATLPKLEQDVDKQKVYNEIKKNIKNNRRAGRISITVGVSSKGMDDLENRGQDLLIKAKRRSDRASIIPAIKSRITG